MRQSLRVIAMCVVSSCWLLAGCTQHKNNDEVGRGRVAPSYAELRDRANARSERLARLWARATVVVWSVVDGQQTKDQGDAVLQVIRPSKLMLSVGKRDLIGFVFYLGSDEDRFWWVDVLDKQNRVALVGTHERANAARAKEFGVPVHPLDLIELLGISGLPEDGPDPVWDEAMAGWSVTVPAQFGKRRVVFDPVEWYPTLIALLDDEGEIAAEATLVDYKRLDEFDGEGLRPEMPSQITIELPSIDSRVLFDFGAVKSIRRLPRSIAFDLDGLLRRERVANIRDLDEQDS